MRPGAAAATASLALLIAGCGKKLPPMAPLQVIPARVTPLRVTQEASDAVLRFPFPSRTNAGEPLSGLTKVTVYRELLPAVAGAPAPPPPEGEARPREEKLFLQRAERVMELSRAELDEATVGRELVVRDSLSQLFASGRLGKVFLRYAVTATRDARRVSELSPLVALRPLLPPGPPRDLLATVEERRVCLDWKPPVEMLDGSLFVTAKAYAVYRRDALEGPDGVYEEPVAVVKHPLYIDEAVVPERRYLYTVRAAPAEARPLVLGPPAVEALADTRDVFPPPVPEGLVVLRETEGVRLVWSPVLAGDLDAYRVYRRGGGEKELRLLAPRVTDTTFFDPKAPEGAAYAVSAVDRSGNESGKVTAAADRR